MMKRLLTFIFILSIAFTLSSATMYFRYGEEYAYDTNAFSSPLPKNADADYLKKADFLKRHNYGTNFAFDTFFTAILPVDLASLSSFWFLSLPPLAKKSVEPIPAFFIASSIA